MNDKEIILKLLDAIENTIQCSDEQFAKGLHLIFIDDPQIAFLKQVHEARLQNILNNLTTDEVISIEHYPISHKEALKKAQDYFQSTFLSIDRYEEPPEGVYDQDYYNYLRSYGFRKLDKYYNYYNKLKQNIIYEIKFSNDGRIIFKDYQNGKSTILRKTQADSNPDNVFSYIYKNRNKEIKVKDILKEQKIVTTRNIHQILSDLGFKGELKSIFFRVSKYTVYFRNPVYEEDIELSDRPKKTNKN